MVSVMTDEAVLQTGMMYQLNIARGKTAEESSVSNQVY